MEGQPNLAKLIANQYLTIERQRLQMLAQRQALEDLTAWVGRHLPTIYPQRKEWIVRAHANALKVLKEFP